MRRSWIWNGLVGKTCPYSSEMAIKKTEHERDSIVWKKSGVLSDSSFTVISVSTFRL